jgi:HK97 family phage major capsid protein
MDAETLRQTFEAYRHAINESRDESLPEDTRDKAAAASIDLRLKIDAALLEDKADREDDERRAAIEAREHAARTVAGIKPVADRGVDMAAYRAFKQSRDQRHFEVEVPFSQAVEQRTTTDITTSDSTTYASRTIPQTWADDVWMFEIASSGVLAAGPTIIRTPNANQINTPTLTTDFAGAMMRTEGSATTDSSYPVIGTVPLNGYPMSGWVSMSDEILRDSGVDFGPLLTSLSGRALGALIGTYLGDEDIGDGSSKPAAITVGTTSAATCASATAVSIDELITLYASVLSVYQSRGSFIANAAVTLSTMLAKNGEGTYLWLPSVAAGVPPTFMGRPWFTDHYFDTSVASNKPVVFGDVAAAYVVRLVGGLTVEFSRDYQFPSFETSMRFQQVIDAATMDTIAVKHLLLAAS